jgi:hypothetical protein
MSFKEHIYRIVIITLFIFVGYGNDFVFSAGLFTCSNVPQTETPVHLNKSLTSFISNNDLVNCRLTVEKLLQQIDSSSIDEGTISDSYYLIGIYSLITKEYFE